MKVKIIIAIFVDIVISLAIAGLLLIFNLSIGDIIGHRFALLTNIISVLIFPIVYIFYFYTLPKKYFDNKTLGRKMTGD